MVTSSPSRIHTVPSPITTSQCQRDQGSRSIRAGMSVVIVPVSTPLIAGLPVRAAATRADADDAHGDRARRPGLRNIQRRTAAGT